MACEPCLIAMALGRRLGLDEETMDQVFHLPLLSYVGCTAGSHELAGYFGDEHDFTHRAAPIASGRPGEMVRLILTSIGGEAPLPRRIGKVLAAAPSLRATYKANSRAHCEVAALLIGALGLDPPVRVAIGSFFERWDGRGFPGTTRGEAIPFAVRVTQVAQEADLFATMSGPDAAEAVLRERAGHAFDPAVVRALLSDPRGLFSLPDVESAWDAVLDAEPGQRPCLEGDAVDRAMAVVAQFADLKSHFTVGHSTGVAALVDAAARRRGMHEDEVADLRRAALLHDVGRVAVSSLVWEKPGPLSVAERERVRLHPYFAERIVDRSPYLQRLGAVASRHPERLDGSGYHRGQRGPELTWAARILAAADAYHAMTEDRPHRAAHHPERAAQLLAEEARVGRLDPDAVSAVIEAAGHVAPKVERPAGLAEREVEVLRLLARGRAVKQIASALGDLLQDRGPSRAEHLRQGRDLHAGGRSRVRMHHDLLAWGESPIPRLPGLS